MDRFIAAMPSQDDGDLALCLDHGVAYQKDMSDLAAYDDEYYNKCASYDGKEIADRINAGRIALVAKHYGNGRVVDIGIGSGEFIRKRPNTFGRDVNPVAIEWLKRNDLWAERLDEFGAHTYWDVIEHLPEPEQYLRNVQLHGFLFASLPIFDDLTRIRESRHYRPNEHLYYFSRDGFENWMHAHGFLLLDHQTFETDAGRDSIHSFAFKRNRWPR